MNTATARKIDSSRNTKGGWNLINKIRQFLKEVVEELKKVTWTTRKELVDSTIVVVTSIFALAVVVGTLDFILTSFLDKIIR